MNFPVHRWWSIVSTLLAGSAISAGVAGCTLGSEPPTADDLRLHFPDQASQVLGTNEAFVAVEGGFGLASTSALKGDADALFHLRGGLHAAMPARGDGDVRFHLPGGFEAHVREIDAEGEGEIVENAVAYRRGDGTSFWSAIDEGYEEWLLLDAGVARADAPAAAWQVDGATLRQQGDAVEVVDESGAARLRVTAPAAYARGGRPIAARLQVHGQTIELWADAGGEPALIDPVWSSAASLSAARDEHTATILHNGKVLVVGGYDGSASVSPAELYNPSNNTWSSAGSLITPRRNHTATLLNSGKVLIVGGFSVGNTVIASAEIYDPATNSWSSTSPMVTARGVHTATQLADFNGRVLVAGGLGASGYLTSVEIFDPSTSSWTTATSLPTSRAGHVAQRLSDGRVLVAGGRNGSYLTSTTLYDPSTNSWTTSGVGSMATARYHAAATWLPVGSGKVLVSGGYNATSNELSSAEVFDSATLAWTSAGTMIVPRVGHTGTLLSSGKVLVTGGDTALTTATKSAQLYDPATNSWSSITSMATERSDHAATLLNSGRVLLTGGHKYGAFSTDYLASSELYDPWTTTWRPAAGTTNGRAWNGLAVLNDGRVLAAGLDSSTSSSPQIYDPSVNGWTSAATPAVSHSWSTTTRLGNGKVLLAGTTLAVTTDSAELYDPAGNSWSPVGAASSSRSDHTATVLSDGRVLIVGGRSTGGTPVPLNTVTIFDPATTMWTVKASMSVARVNHAATLLGNGKVLVTGGFNVGGYLNSSEIYDPGTNTWTSAAPMNSARAEHTLTLMLNGKVLVAGGHDSSTYSTVPQVYDPGLNTWNNTTSITARAGHVAIELNDSSILVVGGFNGSFSSPTVLASALIYYPLSNVWSTAQSLSTARRIPLATELGDGRVLVTGGFGSGGTMLSSSEIYSP
ncbi:kelch repeat-containing protein [Sorangium sp. So ce1000]|uniref:kelch repeat-containing protein n=1 Tax=Sorangium sp. So ce1000 TaxID=3133325 RepID=UPI003F6013B7